MLLFPLNHIFHIDKLIVVHGLASSSSRISAFIFLSRDDFENSRTEGVGETVQNISRVSVRKGYVNLLDDRVPANSGNYIVNSREENANIGACRGLNLRPVLAWLW